MKRSFRDATAALVVAAAAGCAGLIPATLDYVVHMEPVLPEGRGDYHIDLEDSSVVFSKEGVLVKVRPLTDAELNREYPPLADGRHVNPYTRQDRDPDLGYVPPRFTVFQVTVINLSYAKVEFDPAKAVMVTPAGDEYRYYDPGRDGANPLGGNSFSKYYKTELGTSGNEKELNLERMGMVYKTIYHRRRPVFKGAQRTGKLVFDPLPDGTGEITLRFNEFVLSFDASGNPEETVDIEYHFHIDQSVVDAGPAAASASEAGGS